MSDDRFTPGSRYEATEIAEDIGPDGQRRRFLRRRFVAPPAAFSAIAEHTVAAGERLDQIAAVRLEDSLQSWRLCDANLALDPDELLVLGRRLRITLPAGIPGPARNVR